MFISPREIYATGGGAHSWRPSSATIDIIDGYNWHNFCDNNCIAGKSCHDVARKNLGGLPHRCLRIQCGVFYRGRKTAGRRTAKAAVFGGRRRDCSILYVSLL